MAVHRTTTGHPVMLVCQTGIPVPLHLLISISTTVVLLIQCQKMRGSQHLSCQIKTAPAGSQFNQEYDIEQHPLRCIFRPNV